MVNRASLKADMSSILPKNGRFIYSISFPQNIDINECIRNPCHANVTCNNAKRYLILICGSDCFNCTGIQTSNFYSRHRSHTYKLVKKKTNKALLFVPFCFHVHVILGILVTFLTARACKRLIFTLGIEVIHIY